jgi:hypothetical protein
VHLFPAEIILCTRRFLPPCPLFNEPLACRQSFLQGALGPLHPSSPTKSLHHSHVRLLLFAVPLSPRTLTRTTQVLLPPLPPFLTRHHRRTPTSRTTAFSIFSTNLNHQSSISLSKADFYFTPQQPTQQGQVPRTRDRIVVYLQQSPPSSFRLDPIAPAKSPIVSVYLFVFHRQRH